MTMLSFRVSEAEAERMAAWAKRLGLRRSDLLRDALRRRLNALASEEDATAWQARPLTDDERALEGVSDWGPAEDWSDWGDASG